VKIGVCLKQVPDTAAKITVKPDGTGISEENVKYVISPYDEYAVEEALRTRDKVPGSEVVALCVGPKRVQESLRSALAMGCDRAVHVQSPDGASLDGLGVARLLAAQIKAENLELVFTGKTAADDDNSQVTQMLAELLAWPHVTAVNKFEMDAGGKKARVEKDVEGGSRQVWEIRFPGVVAATKGLNEPRYASLKGIMQAKKKPMKEVPMDQCGVPAADLTSKVAYRNFRVPPGRQAGKVFKDDPKKSAQEVVRLLREEAKVI
jgi:electron transfer flavoprotein beta subunit